MKLDFVCPGAAKCATTTLYNILRQHDGIYLPKVAETNFFALQYLYDKGTSWYAKEFYSSASESLKVGDISTAYMTFAEIAVKRLRECCHEKTKLIFMIREPVRRAYSHYCMRRYNNLAEEEQFCDLVKRIATRIRQYDEKQLEELSKGYSYIKRIDDRSIDLDDWKYVHYFKNGLYNQTIEVFERYFLKDNIKVILFEDFATNQKEITEEIFDFIGCSNYSKIELNIKSNVSGRIKYPIVHKIIRKTGSIAILREIGLRAIGHSQSTKLYYWAKNLNRVNHKPPPIKKETEKYLYNFYRKDIEDLEKRIGRKLNQWRKD